MKKLLLSKEHSKKRGCFLGHCDGTSPQFEEEGADNPEFKRSMFDSHHQHEKEWRDKERKNMPKAWVPPAQAVKQDTRSPFDAVPADHDPALLGTRTPAWARTPDSPDPEVPLNPEFENHSGHAKKWQEDEKKQAAQALSHEGFLGELGDELRSQFTEGKEAFKGHLANTEWGDLPGGPSVAEVQKAMVDVENAALPEMPKMAASPAKGLSWSGMEEGLKKARAAAGEALQNALAPKEPEHTEEAGLGGGAKMEKDVAQTDVKAAIPAWNPKEKDQKPAAAWKPAAADGKDKAIEDISVQSGNPVPEDTSASSDAFKQGSVELPKFENPFYAGSGNAENAKTLFDVVSKQFNEAMGTPTVASEDSA